MKVIDQDRFLFSDHRELLELRREIELDGIPNDKDDPRYHFCQMVDQAEGLRVLFGGHPDRGAVDAAKDLVEVVREVYRKRDRVTHDIPKTRH